MQSQLNQREATMTNSTTHHINWKKGDRIIIDYGDNDGIWTATVTTVRQQKVYFVFDVQPIKKDSCSLESDKILGIGFAKKRKSPIPRDHINSFLRSPTAPHNTSPTGTTASHTDAEPLVEYNNTDTSPENQSEVVVLDFETTGLDCDYDRVIEVGAAIIKDGQVVDTFSQLMNPGRSIPYFITELTGITNAMVKNKPSPKKVMPMLKKFLDNRTILAHNASFDIRFLQAEMARAGLNVDNLAVCTMLLARRLIAMAPNYRLQTLVTHLGLKQQDNHKAHRALDDVMVTKELWRYLENLVSKKTGIKNVDISVFKKITSKPKNAVPSFLEKLARQA